MPAPTIKFRGVSLAGDDYVFGWLYIDDDGHYIILSEEDKDYAVHKDSSIF